MPNHVEVPQQIVKQYFADRAKAEGAAFTAFCAEHGYVRDIFEFTDSQCAEWNAVYDALAVDWDAKREAIKAEHADDKASSAEAQGS